MKKSRKICFVTLLLLLVQFSACTMNNVSEVSSNNPVEESQSDNSNGDEDENGVYIVTFDTAGGSVIDPQTVLYGEKAVRPNDPTKNPDSKYEYVFAGWYFEDREWNFEIDIVRADMTLTAKWDVESIYTPPFTPSD